MHQSRLPILLLCALLAGCAASPSAPSTIASPDEVLSEAIADGRLPGAVAIVADAHGILYSAAVGLADVARGEPMQLDSMFRIASMTKPVTSAALMQLVERGDVDLDAPLSRYVPEFDPRPVLLRIDERGPHFSSDAFEPTVRQLLTHTSGFGYTVWNNRLRAVSVFSEGDPAGFMQEPLVNVPGSRWEYSTGIDWAGVIVERVSGLSLAEYFRREITGPLGMDDTFFNVPVARQPRVVTVHRRTEAGLAEIPNRRFPVVSFFNGGHGLVSTAGDYVRFMQMFLSGSDAHGRHLSADSIAAMTRNQIGDLEVRPMRTVMPEFSNDFALLPGSVSRFGLGFLINETDMPGRRRAGSLAWAGLYNTYFWIDPDSGICGVLMTQVLPFFDADIATLFADFERSVYAHLLKAAVR
jgi:CubicO group peptidase (beta-lactamase class C family)